MGRHELHLSAIHCGNGILDRTPLCAGRGEADLFPPLRSATLTGLPLGDEAFVSALEAHSGRSLRLEKRGPTPQVALWAGGHSSFGNSGDWKLRKNRVPVQTGSCDKNIAAIRRRTRDRATSRGRFACLKPIIVFSRRSLRLIFSQLPDTTLTQSPRFRIAHAGARGRPRHMRKAKNHRSVENDPES